MNRREFIDGCKYLLALPFLPRIVQTPPDVKEKILEDIESNLADAYVQEFTANVERLSRQHVSRLHSPTARQKAYLRWTGAPAHGESGRK